MVSGGTEEVSGAAGCTGDDGSFIPPQRTAGVVIVSCTTRLVPDDVPHGTAACSCSAPGPEPARKPH